MSEMSEVEKNIRASAVMDFVEMIRGAYCAGFIDNNPNNYDIYRSAQVHVKDRYGVETDNWDDEFADESKSDTQPRIADYLKANEPMLAKTKAKMVSIESLKEFAGIKDSDND